MGSNLTTSWINVFQKQRRHVLLLGLDNAGKTTTWLLLKHSEEVDTILSLGFTVETMHYNNIELTTWGTALKDHVRRFLRHYLPHTDAIAFVVDSADPDRFQEASEALRYIFEALELSVVKLLVLANKLDLPRAKSPSEIAEKMTLEPIATNSRTILPCSATTGTGVFEGLEWLK
ncbi:Aste57867_9135 [Aphanomyces stellatus]|uniref:Aste57867_9135 protein n=1 Tax=Aphanomyces stellatus TaxID=120398 RepID=A0A485KM35_9STRA|nr:hypothetical protein As57867_009099 [Aphanomyces stellatus]VFT86019.1 Aste57867_9135 [Aphanomyces stellatus]